MSILTPEISSQYGALDSDAAVADGDLPDAAIGRVLAMSANRALARPDGPLLQEIYDVSGDNDEIPDGAMAGFGWPQWVPIVPGPQTRVKFPGHSRAKLNVYAWARTDEIIYVQIATLAAPFTPVASAGSSNTLEIVGTGAWEWYELDDVPIDVGYVEAITVYLRGEVTDTAGDETVYGGVGSYNSGTVDQFVGADHFYSYGANWNIPPSANWANGGHAVVFEDGSGNPLTSPRWIVGVSASGSAIQFSPGLSSAFEGQALEGSTFRILELPLWRIGNIALYPKAREP